MELESGGLPVIKLSELMKLIQCDHNKNILNSLYGNTPKIKPLEKRNPIPIQSLIKSHIPNANSNKILETYNNTNSTGPFKKINNIN